MAAGLFAKLQSGSLTGRDQHETRFVLNVLADWPDLEDDLRTRVFQRLNLYAIVAAHGWPTAIAASAASTSNLVCVLPPGVIRCSSRGSNENPNARLGRVVGARPTSGQQQLQQFKPQLRQLVDDGKNASRFFF